MKNILNRIEVLTARNIVLESLFASEVLKNEELYLVIEKILDNKKAKVPAKCDNNKIHSQETRIKNNPSDFEIDRNLTGFDLVEMGIKTAQDDNTIKSFKIENNVPIPEINKPTSTIRLTLSKLNVGESFTISSYEKHKVSRIVSLHFHSTTVKKFTVRKINETQSRVWRTS